MMEISDVGSDDTRRLAVGNHGYADEARLRGLGWPRSTLRLAGGGWKPRLRRRRSAWRLAVGNRGYTDKARLRGLSLAVGNRGYTDEARLRGLGWPRSTLRLAAGSGLHPDLSSTPSTPPTPYSLLPTPYSLLPTPRFDSRCPFV